MIGQSRNLNYTRKNWGNKGLGMNDRFIQKVFIDWNKIEASSFLRSIEALHNLHEVEFKKNITFFVGENGTGKSTLLEAIAVSYGFNPEGGTLNYRFSTYDEVSKFSKAISIAKGVRQGITNYFFRAEIISFENGKIESCNYEDTKSYQVTEMFINNREILTEYLLNESEREE